MDEIGDQGVVQQALPYIARQGDDLDFVESEWEEPKLVEYLADRQVAEIFAKFGPVEQQW